ncbi:MAG: hypothetical protein FJ253_11575 [Phycisphaerae bacterium]|nr:hypothetical protein [Phycisphaerae bacterium]
MRTRAWTLRIVLGLLAFIAIGAVLGALSESWETIGRVIGTGVLAGAIGLLSIPLMGLAERPNLKLGATAALVYLGVETVALVLGIWLVDRGGSDVGERLLLGALFGSITLLPTVAALFAAPFLPSWRLPIAVICISAIALMLCAPMIVIGSTWGPGAAAEEPPILGVSLAIVGLMLLGALARSRDESALPGLLLSVPPIGAVAATAYMLFGPVRGWLGSPIAGVPLEAIMSVLWSGSMVLVIWHASRLLDLRGAQRHLRIAFLAAGLLGTLLVASSVTVESVGAAALGAACFVVDACILVAIAVFVRVNRRAEVGSLLLNAVPGAIECPRCRHTIELRPGHGACSACGLSYRLDLETPRCRRCKHDVTHTESPVCSECGEPILLPTADAVGARAAPVAS